MAFIRNTVHPAWQIGSWGVSGKVERDLRDISHMSLVVFAVTAVMAGIIALISLSSKLGIGASASFILVAFLFPLLCGLLAKEVWHAKQLEAQLRDRQAAARFAGSDLKSKDCTPAGLLIVSPDLRIRFANQKFLESALQEPEEVLGWKIQDVLLADGVDEQASVLLGRSDPAASCCFNTFARAGLSCERPVHITMTRIAPQQGEDRILVVVEDLVQGCLPRVDEPVEGYIC